MLSDADLGSMSAEERADLARRLAVFSAPLLSESPERRRRRRYFTDLMVVCCVGLIPWIGFLAVTLPHHYEAGHWTAAWVGFDVALLAGLAVTAWAGRQRRQVLVVSALVTGTLLFTDAWFDVLTSSSAGDLIVSLLTAVGVEIPLGILLVRTALRIIRASVRGARYLAGSEEVDLPLLRVPLLALDDPVKEVVRRVDPADGSTDVS